MDELHLLRVVTLKIVDEQVEIAEEVLAYYV
jgi:hypothetical protein